MNKLEEQPWCCPKCGYVLGMFRGRRLALGLRKTRYLVVGSVLSVCPTCHELTEVHVLPPAPPSEDDGPEPAALVSP